MKPQDWAFILIVGGITYKAGFDLLMIPAAILFAGLFWSILSLTDDDKSQAEKTRLAALFVLFTMIFGIVAVTLKVTVGLPVEYGLIGLAYCITSLPAIAQIKLSPTKQ